MKNKAKIISGVSLGALITGSITTPITYYSIKEKTQKINNDKMYSYNDYHKIKNWLDRYRKIMYDLGYNSTDINAELKKFNAYVNGLIHKNNAKDKKHQNKIFNYQSTIFNHLKEISNLKNEKEILEIKNVSKDTIIKELREKLKQLETELKNKIIIQPKNDDNKKLIIDEINKILNVDNPSFKYFSQDRQRIRKIKYFCNLLKNNWNNRVFKKLIQIEYQKYPIIKKAIEKIKNLI